MNEQTPNENGEVILDRDTMLQELLTHCNGFVDKSWEWRRNSFDPMWRKWQRAADSIFDPELASKKESWQSKAYWPITASHLENAVAQLYKAEVGPRLPIDVTPRPGVLPDEDQSRNIRDLILREREKSGFAIERNKGVLDKVVFGSSFARMYFDEKIEERPAKEPQYEPVSLFDPTSIHRAMTGQRRVVGYTDTSAMKAIYRGVRFEHLPVWDVFPDPRALEIKGHDIACRYSQTLEDIMVGIRDGYNIEECYEKLKSLPSDELTTEDKKAVEADRSISDSAIKRVERGSNLTCYELYARLPKKWIYLDGQPIDDPEALMPARVRFHKSTIIGVEVNSQYDGEAPIFHDRYMVVPGQFYGRGIPEMLKDVQAVTNEQINQRLDSAAITLNPMFAVIEKGVVDTNDFVSKTGGVIRLKASAGTTDIRQIFQRIDMGTVDRASYIEPQEWERAAQERTSVNRVTLGTAGQVKDANQTLGGQELLQQSMGEKFAYIGLVSEFDAQAKIAKEYWKLIYQNIRPEDVIMALGPERAQSFKLLSPEEIENGYQYVISGIMTMESKARKQQSLANARMQFQGAPWLDQLAFFKAIVGAGDDNPEEFIVKEADAIQIQGMAQAMAQEQAQQMAPEMAAEMLKKHLAMASLEKRSINDALPKEPAK